MGHKTTSDAENQSPRDFWRVTPSSSILYGHHHNIFGHHNTLVIGRKSITAAIQSKKIVFKTRIVVNGKFPTKFLYVMEIRTQRWLGECQKHSDRSMVNDRLICFEEVMETVLNSSLNVTLPPILSSHLPKGQHPNSPPSQGMTESRRTTRERPTKSEKST